MIKFLLILILFSPAEGRYRDTVGVFESEAACEKVKFQVRQSIRPEPGIIFVLACLPAQPTNSSDV